MDNISCFVVWWSFFFNQGGFFYFFLPSSRWSIWIWQWNQHCGRFLWSFLSGWNPQHPGEWVVHSVWEQPAPQGISKLWSQCTGKFLSSQFFITKLLPKASLMKICRAASVPWFVQLFLPWWPHTAMATLIMCYWLQGLIMGNAN